MVANNQSGRQGSAGRPPYRNNQLVLTHPKASSSRRASSQTPEQRPLESTSNTVPSPPTQYDPMTKAPPPRPTTSNDTDLLDTGPVRPRYPRRTHGYDSGDNNTYPKYDYQNKGGPKFVNSGHHEYYKNNKLGHKAMTKYAMTAGNKLHLNRIINPGLGFQATPPPPPPSPMSMSPPKFADPGHDFAHHPKHIGRTAHFRPHPINPQAVFNPPHPFGGFAPPPNTHMHHITPPPHRVMPPIHPLQPPNIHNSRLNMAQTHTGALARGNFPTPGFGHLPPTNKHAFNPKLAYKRPYRHFGRYPGQTEEHFDTKNFHLAPLHDTLAEFLNHFTHIEKVTNRVGFSIVSLFRVRVGYRLRPFEEQYLRTIDQVCRYMLFIYELGFHKQGLNLTHDHGSMLVSTAADNKLVNFAGSESDVSMVDNVFKANEHTSIDTTGYLMVRWDTTPHHTYIFRNNAIDTSPAPEKIVLVKSVSLNTMLGSRSSIENLSGVHPGVDAVFMSFLGHYCLVCNDEAYIEFISVVMPTLTTTQLELFYIGLASLLNDSYTSLQTQFLERFVERILPICLTHGPSCWRPVIANVVRTINPLKLGRKRYIDCVISLIRTLKSFCENFAQCETTSFSVFLMGLKIVLQSSDDSRILIRGEATELMVQVWLKSPSKVMARLNYDILRILASVSGIQAIKLNIWGFVLSAVSENGLDKLGNPANIVQPLAGVFGAVATNVNSDWITYLITLEEFDFLHNLQTNFSLSQSNYKPSNANLEAIKSRTTVFLSWYVTKFLRITKKTYQFEKLSIITRAVFHLIVSRFLSAYANIVASKMIGNDEHQEMLQYFVPFVEKPNNYYAFLEQAVAMLSWDPSYATAVFESTNMKTSLVIDVLLFNHMTNSKVHQRFGSSRDVKQCSKNNPAHSTAQTLRDSCVTINGRYYRNFNIMNDNSSVLLASIYSALCRFNSPEVAEQLETMRVTGFIPHCETKDSAKVSNNGINILNVLVSTGFWGYLLNSDCRMLKTILDYLENLVSHFDPELYPVYYLNVVSALVMTSIGHVMADKQNKFGFPQWQEDGKYTAAFVKVDDPKDVVECLKRTPIHRLLGTFSINVNNLNFTAAPLRLDFDGDEGTGEKHGYSKIIVKNMVCADILTKFMLTQAYLLVTEFFCNFGFFINRGLYDETPIKHSDLFTGTDSLKYELNVDGSETTLDDTLIVKLVLSRDFNVLFGFFDTFVVYYEPPNYYLLYNPPTEHTDLDGPLAMVSNTFAKLKFGFENNSDSSVEFGQSQAMGKVIDAVASVVCAVVVNGFGRSAEQYLKAVLDAFEDCLVEIYDLNKLVLYELLYYVGISGLVSMNEQGNDNDADAGEQLDELNTSLKRLIKHKQTVVLRVFNGVVSKLASKSGMPVQDVFDSFLRDAEGMFCASLDDSKAKEGSDNPKVCAGHKKLAFNLRFVFQAILFDGSLFKHFTQYPAAAAFMLKYSSINDLVVYFSNFRSLFEEPFSPFSVHCECANNELVDILDDKWYNMCVMNNILYMIKKCGSSNNDKINLTIWFRCYFLYWQLLVRLFESCHFSRAETVTHLVSNPKIPAENRASIESKIKEKIQESRATIMADRNFYRYFVLPRIETANFSGCEFLTKASVSNIFSAFYQNLNTDDTKNIDGSNNSGVASRSVGSLWCEHRSIYRNCSLYSPVSLSAVEVGVQGSNGGDDVICYVGDYNDKSSLFVYYMTGYSLFGPPSGCGPTGSNDAKVAISPNQVSDDTESGEPDLDFLVAPRVHKKEHFPHSDDEIKTQKDEQKLYLLLYLFHKSLDTKNLRLVEVPIFSLFPIFAHMAPKKVVFDSVYSALVHIFKLTLATPEVVRPGQKRRTKQPMVREDPKDPRWRFMMYLLLTLLFNWYHRHFFTYNFFIYQVNNRNVVDKGLIAEYIRRFGSRNSVEFSFNSTKVVFPIEVVYQIEVLF